MTHPPLPNAGEREDVASTTMRAPKDIVRMVKALAAVTDLSMEEWLACEMRPWLAEKFRARMSRVGELSGGT